MTTRTVGSTSIRHSRAILSLLCLVLLLPGVGVAASSLAPKIAPGEVAPDFELVDSAGNTHRLSEYLDGETIVVLEWFNPNCSYDKIHYGSDHRTMQSLQQKFKDMGVVWFAINSGCEASGTADPELCEQRREEWSMEYPVLMDTSGEVGRLYRAKTTPQMYVINTDGTFAYMGAIDSQRYLLRTVEETIDTPVTNYVNEALSSIVAGEQVQKPLARTYGCKIKY